jgi:hypothetical protein
MYLGDYDHAQLGGLGSKLKKALKKATAPLMKPIQQVHRVIEKNTPQKLVPLVSRMHASIERGTQMALTPHESGNLLKAEVKQMEQARKDPEFMRLVGSIMAVVAIVYPFLQPVAAAMTALRVAAERTAAKKLMAKDQAEADAAQREFDEYAAELAKLQQEYAALQATPVAPSPSSAPMVAQPITPSQQLAPVTSFAPRASAQGIDRELERQAQESDALPSWAIPAALGGAVLVMALPLLSSRSAPRRKQEH